MILKRLSLLNLFDQMDCRPLWENLSFQVMLIIFLTLNGLPTKAQTGDMVIDGRVVDAADGDAIKYAHVFIENHDHIGVVTDEEGAFTLRIPGFIDDDYLIISALGFTTKKISLDAVRYSAHEIFELDRMAIMLNDVVVTADRYDLEWICQEALRRIPKNYPDKVHYLEGFYRKVSTDGTQYTGLVEAVIGIKDPGYDKIGEEVKIQVHHARYGDNNLSMDTLAMKVGTAVSQEFDAPAFKSLHSFYEYNAMRLYKKPHTVFNIQGMTFAFPKGERQIMQKAELQNITIDRGDTILHIVVKLYTSEKLIDLIRVSINLSDLAIVEFTTQMFEFKTTVKFAKHINGTYYPYFFQRVTPTLNDLDKGKAYLDIETFQADIVEIDPGKIPKIRHGEDRMERFDPRRFAYDARFWAQYFKEHSLHADMDDDVIRSLERLRRLEQQYTNKTVKPQ